METSTRYPEICKNEQDCAAIVEAIIRDEPYPLQARCGKTCRGTFIVRAKEEVRIAKCEKVNIRPIKEEQTCHQLKPYMIIKSGAIRYYDPISQILYKYDREVDCRAKINNS